jgi:hypothetical protein
MTIQLTPAERALLQGVAIPDLPVGALPSIKLLQTNSPELLNANDNEMFLEGATAGGFVAPHREGRVFLPSPPGFRFQIFGWDKFYYEYEKRADGTDGRPVDKHLDKPQDAHWLDAGVPKPGYYRANGNRIVETLGCYMRLPETGQVGRFDFSKTALRIGRELADRSQRLKIEGEEIKGAVVGLFLMVSRVEKKNDRRWFLPAPQFLGKLGAVNGPSLADVLACAALRQAFLKGAPLPEPPEQPAIAASPPERPRPIITSGGAALAGPEPPPSAPPPTSYDGPDDGPNDDIDF